MDELERFGALVRADAGRLPLDVACLLVAGALDGGVDVDRERARLDDLAAAVTGRTLADVADHLFGVEGFAGDRRDYYDPANSLLPRVLDRRVGIPISLAVLTIEVARRIGVPAVGVSMPGHFLVGDPADDDAFIDGFSGGVVLDRAAAERLFAHLHGDDVAFEPSYLDPAPAGLIVARMLANLRQTYATRGDRQQLVRVLELRCAMPGASASERGALAETLAAVGRFDDAAKLLERTAESAPSATAARLRASAQGLRARLN